MLKLKPLTVASRTFKSKQLEEADKQRMVISSCVYIHFLWVTLFWVLVCTFYWHYLLGINRSVEGGKEEVQPRYRTSSAMLAGLYTLVPFFIDWKICLMFIIADLKNNLIKSNIDLTIILHWNALRLQNIAPDI